MSESKFRDDEIERLRRQASGKRQNVDYDLLRTKQDFVQAARTDSLEVFQAKLTAYGVDINSDRGKTIMEAYWAIRRELRR
jgi:hypothetical protein